MIYKDLHGDSSLSPYNHTQAAGVQGPDHSSHYCQVSKQFI